MAKVNTTFGFTDNVTNPLRKMTSALKDTENSFSSVQKTIITVNSAMSLITMAVGAVKGVINKLNSAMSESIGAYQYQAEQELKLETIMKKRMNATQADIQYIKDLAGAEQRLGIYGDEMILQGAQELASFTSNKRAIAELVPAMNNLIAQQYGYNASGREFQSVADMMGKVLSGQTGALSRMGYIFSEEEKQLLKTGTEMQRASVLAKIITDNVGDMNHALAGTDAGQIQNVANRLSDLKENIGKTLLPLQGAMSRLKNSFTGDFLTSLNNVLNKIVPVFVSILNGINAVYSGVKNILNKVVNGLASFVQNVEKNLNAVAVALAGVGVAVTALGVIWVATHAKMVAVTIASVAKITAQFAVMVAQHAAQMVKMAVQWIIGLGPVAWIVAGVIALIVGLIALAVKLGATFEKVGAGIGKVFGAVYAAGYNAIMALINLFIRLQNVIADSFIGKNLGMQKWELREYKNIKETMDAGAEKGGRIGKGMDDWVNGLKDKFSPKTIAEGIKEGFNFNGAGDLTVSDKNIVDIADDYRELLSKRAVERFNLQYKNVVPTVNIDKVDVHKEADLGKTVAMLADRMDETASGSLGVA